MDNLMSVRKITVEIQVECYETDFRADISKLPTFRWAIKKQAATTFNSSIQYSELH